MRLVFDLRATIVRVHMCLMVFNPLMHRLFSHSCVPVHKGTFTQRERFCAIQYSTNNLKVGSTYLDWCTIYCKSNEMRSLYVVYAYSHRHIKLKMIYVLRFSSSFCLLPRREKETRKYLRIRLLKPTYHSIMSSHRIRDNNNHSRTAKSIAHFYGKQNPAALCHLRLKAYLYTLTVIFKGKCIYLLEWLGLRIRTAHFET